MIRLFPQAKQKISEYFSLSSPVTRVHSLHRKSTKLVPEALVKPAVSSTMNVESSKNCEISEIVPTSSTKNVESSCGSNEQESTSSFAGSMQEDTNGYSTLGCLGKNWSSLNSGVKENSFIIHRRPTPPAYYHPAGYPVRGVISCQSSLRQIKEHAPTNFKNEFSTPLPKYPLAVVPYHSQRSRLGMKCNVQMSSSEHTELYEERLKQSREELIKQDIRIRESMGALVPPKRTLGEFYAADTDGNPMPTPTPPLSPKASQVQLDSELLGEVRNVGYTVAQL